MDANDPRYDYKRGTVKGKRVGQAVLDILEKEHNSYTTGDIIDGFAPKFLKTLEETIEANRTKYESPFYIIVLTRKEFWANNVVRNYFIARQTPPHALQLMRDYQWYTKTLYVVNDRCGEVKLAWSLPAFQECKTVAKNPFIYPPALVSWVNACFTGQLERDEYNYLFS